MVSSRKKLASVTCGLALIGGMSAAAYAGPPSDDDPGRHTAAQPRDSRLDLAHKAINNPGPIWTGRRWIVLKTGSVRGRRMIWTAPRADGRYRRVRHRFLKDVKGGGSWPLALDKGAAVWAPAITRLKNGTFKAFYAGEHKSPRVDRCIFTATAETAAGPFQPQMRPISCISSAGKSFQDTVRSEGRGMGLIDPTPSWFTGRDGRRYLVLTYKTEYKSDGRWHTTQRVVQLDPGSGRVVKNPYGGTSIRIANSWSQYIEENPVLVKRGNTFTLFTSFGYYGRCNYYTSYRQSNRLWRGWKGQERTRLRFPKDPAGKCARGNAQPALGPGGWRLFYNVHKSPERRSDFHLRVAPLRWRDGRPVVKRVIGPTR